MLTPLGLGVSEAAARLGVSRVTLSRGLNGRAGISPDLARRFEQAVVSTARFWLTLQTHYELRVRRNKSDHVSNPYNPRENAEGDRADQALGLLSSSLSRPYWRKL